MLIKRVHNFNDYQTLKTPKQEILVMSNDANEEYLERLAQYIRDMVKNNHHIPAIREELKANGHSEEAIDQAILKA